MLMAPKALGKGVMEFFQASRERKHAGILARVVGSCRGRALVFLEIQGGEHTRCEQAEGTAYVKARKRAGVEMLHETLGAALVGSGSSLCRGLAWVCPWERGAQREQEAHVGLA